MLGVHFAAQDRHAVDALHAKAKAFGTHVTGAPAELPASAGGGYGFQFRTPEGHVLNIAADVAQHPNVVNDRSRPLKVAHVVLNSAKIDEHRKERVHVSEPVGPGRRIGIDHVGVCY